MISVTGKYIMNKLFCSVNFIHRIEQLFGNLLDSEGWLDNEALCKRLIISKCTLQSYRDMGKNSSFNDRTQLLL